MIMRALSLSLQEGWRHRKIWLLFWFLNLLMVVFFLLPYLRAFHSSFQHRLVTGLLAQENIYTYYAEFYYTMAPVISTLPHYLTASGILHALFIMVVSGGIASLFLERLPADYRKFFIHAGHLGWRMIRLGLILFVLWLIALVTGIVSCLLFWKYLPAGMTERGYFYTLLAGIVFTGLLMLVASLIIDMARILIAQYDLKRVIPATGLAVSRLAKNFPRFFIYYIAIFFLWSGSILLYWILQTWITPMTDTGFVLEFLVLQGYIIFLYGLRFSRYGGLVYLMDLPSRSEGDLVPDAGKAQTRLNS